ncbi:MAG: hypothetical protein HOE19_01025 [Candidatus Komeilibacteria bacterium]|jgi:hypothetical protein|nr:hypothetical protein [Candidatus Komeilibacteria bacterium]MBT4447128.1 hypothetical protein [Candidatus Komeilibacteria bacterium]
MFGNKNKIGFFSAKTSKKVASSHVPLNLQITDGMPLRIIDGMPADGMPVEGMRIDGIIRRKSLIKEELKIEEEKSTIEKIDNRKRTFLKTAGFAGVGLAASTLLPKKAEAYVAGSTPTSNVVGLKNIANDKINPATEETAASLLKTSDLTFDAGSLEVKVTSIPAGAGASSFSDSGDVARSALVDGDRHVQVDVLSSALPTTASTETTLQTISFGGFKFALRMVTDGDYDYLGEAAIGSGTSSAVWRVKRIDYASGVVIVWAGTGAFDQIWDNYASLT